MSTNKTLEILEDRASTLRSVHSRSYGFPGNTCLCPKRFWGRPYWDRGAIGLNYKANLKLIQTFSAQFQMFTSVHSILFISFIPVIYTNIATSKYYSKCIFFLPYEPSRLYARSHLDTFPLFVSSNHILTYLNSSMWDHMLLMI